MRLICATLAVLTFASPGRAESDRCVAFEPIAETHCSNNDSLSVIARNACPSVVHFRICIEQRGGTQSCGSDFIDPHKTFTYYACRPDGRFSGRIVD